MTTPLLGPLKWNVPIVDASGRPTNEFMRLWNAQRTVNGDMLQVPVFGTGVPVDSSTEGQFYFDTTTAPPTLYVYHNSAWEKAGFTNFTELLDGAGSFTGKSLELVRVKSDETKLEYVAPASLTANPTATASDTAVNGSAATFMRSDAAPAVQKGLSSQFGVVKVDGTTITSTAGVLSAAAGTGVLPANPTATASDTVVNGVATTYMRSDAAPAVQKGSSSQFGVIKVDGVTVTESGGVISAAPGVSAANPTATASDAAVNGVATTFMRSDAAPAVQKGLSTQFGVVKVDGTTVTSASGVISTPGGANPSATASDTAVNGSATTFMRSDAAPAIQKATSAKFGVVEVDGTTITASGGVISAAAGTGSAYVLKAGDTMSGPLALPDGSYATPALTFKTGGGFFYNDGTYNLAVAGGSVHKGDFLVVTTGGATQRLLGVSEGALTLSMRNFTSGASGPAFVGSHNRGTVAAPTAPLQNDILQTIRSSFVKAAGTTTMNVSELRYQVIAATPSDTDAQSRETLFLCPAASVTLTEMRRFDLATGFWMYGSNVIDQNRSFRTPASSTSTAGLNLPHGSAPTSPTNGDVWTTTVGAYAQINGSTVGPLAAAVAGANPSATASDTAVNGSATTYMRSDAAPAVQKASSSVFGVVKVDGTTVTASGGVISAAAGVSGANPTATASDTAVNGSAATFMRSDAAPAVQKTSSSVFGIAKVDGTTITASSGVVSTPGGANPTATASDTAVNGSAATFMRSDAAPAIQKTSSSVFGLAKVDGTSILASGGVISASSTSSALVYQDGTVPAGNTVANTTTATAFTSAYTVAANTLTVGAVIRVLLFGVYGTAVVVPTLTLTVALGGTTLVATGTLSTLASLGNNLGWMAEALLTVTSIGASGQVEAQGAAEFATAAATGINVSMTNTAKITIDTTASNSLTVKAQWGTANASNTITLREMAVWIEKVGSSANTNIDKFGPPAAADFTITTVGSPTTAPTLTDVSGLGMVFSGGSTVTTAAINTQVALKNIPGATPWTISTRLRFNLVTTRQRGAGLVLSDGTKVIFFGVITQAGGTGTRILRNNTTISFNTNVVDMGAFGLSSYEYFQIKDDGTNWIYSVSNDGTTWTRVLSEARNTFLTATKIGLAVETSHISGTPVAQGDIPSVTVPWWSQT